jgi:hypothetical protein
LLLYFAAKYKAPLYTWTAVSKPPYFTALALWPKGNGYGGGGIFDNDFNIRLNHTSCENTLAEGFSLKKGMKVDLCGQWSGGGEDLPINGALRKLNGWKLIDEGECKKPDWNNNPVWEYALPRFYERQVKGYTLQEQLKGVNQRNGAWYWQDYTLLNPDREPLFSLAHTDWADLDTNGDLLFAQHGKLFRLNKKNFARFQNKGLEAAKLIADFTDMKFEAIPAPHKATIW